MRNTYTVHNDYQAVVSFIRGRVKAGIKQTDLAQGIGKSVSFINRLYLDKNVKKIIDPEQQEKIARYFGISREEMLEEGRQWMQQNAKKIDTEAEKKEVERIRKRLRTGRTSFDFFPGWKMPGYPQDNDNLAEQLKRTAIFLSQGITEMQFQAQEEIRRAKEKASREKKEVIRSFEKKIDGLEKIIKINKAIYNALDEDVAFFNPQRQCVFSSDNGWFSCNTFPSLGQSPTIDRCLLVLRPDISNFDEFEENMQKAFDIREQSEFIAKMGNQKIRDAEFKIKTTPIFNNGIFEGTFISIMFHRLSPDPD